MEKMELIPTGAQVPVGCASLRLATAIDILCKDKHGKYSLVENKHGYASYVDDSSGQMAAPLSTHNNSPANQFQVQLALTQFLFKTSYPHKQLGSSYIIRHHAQGVEVEPLKPWALRSQCAMISAIAKRR